MKLEPQKQKATFDSTIPLINVVFLMLIFFMVAGTITTGMRADIIPPTVTATSEREQVAEAVFIDSSGRLFIGDNELEPQGIPAGPYTEENPLTLVVDRSLSAQQLTEILSALKAQGIGYVALVTERGGN
ncbi:biopolymer transporter ExbD [Rhodobacteraceae bacterium RKSG542]|uniref:ExbD/TolR family protein n=1 Tax=Pseudovibrio flavus TaxID=2529854 RepID=UPI0012BD4C35|nr:biopolymer transporter ExbD [Pseudovibrio flavus]MTI17304.1 biopolymer transporter ExbD [Pseudovibrio flavus]